MNSFNTKDSKDTKESRNDSDERSYAWSLPTGIDALRFSKNLSLTILRVLCVLRVKAFDVPLCPLWWCFDVYAYTRDR
jgi:hypothetical protein